MDLFEEVRSEIFQIAATIKNAHFSHEREVRFISPVIELADSQVKFRPSRTTLIPYVEFKIGDAGEPMSVPEVMIGPSPSQALTVAATAAIVQQLTNRGKIVGDWQVRPSDIPYREI